MSIKEKLREKSMRTIMECSSADRFKPTFVEIFSNLVKFKESLFAALECLKKPGQVKFCTRIFELLEKTFQEEEINEKEDIKKICRFFLEIVNEQLPHSNTKVDKRAMSFIIAAASATFKFSEDFVEILKEDNNLLVQNVYVQMYLLQIYNLSDSTSLKDIVFPFMNPKLPFGANSLITVQIIAKEDVFGDEKPTLKSIISLFKSSCDNGVCSFIIPSFLLCLEKYGSASTVKEVASIIPLVLKKIEKDSDEMKGFIDFIMKFTDFEDALQAIKSLSEEFLNNLMQAIKNSANITEETEDLYNSLDTELAKDVTKICEKFEVNECFYLHQKASNYPSSVLMLSLFICREMDVKMFESVNKEEMLSDLADVFKEGAPEYQLLIALCGYFVINFNSRRGLEILVSALKVGSLQASEWILSKEMKFETVFTELASEFDPEKSGKLYYKTLISLLQANVQPVPDEIPADDSITTYSDSNFDSVSGMSRYSCDCHDIENLQGVPTPETTLFCTVISKYIDIPELVTLLQLSASAISPAFASDLTKNMRAQKRRRSKLELVASYSNSLQSLDIQTLHSLAQTFLLLSPGMSMLFLAVSLQRLPVNIIKSMIQKTTAFAASSPDLFARMIALLSHSHTDIAINFMDNFIDSTLQKRKMFFFLRSASEGNERNIIAVFKCIGYCSAFIDEIYFESDFLPFATRFLDKYLTHQSKNIEIFRVQLFAIKKLSIRLRKYQDQNRDHIFPFKDFLTQFVCAYYMDVGDDIINKEKPRISMVSLCLQTLTSLMSVRPVRSNDKYERSVEITAYIMQSANEENFTTLLKPATSFFTELIKTNQSIFIVIDILAPFSSVILKSECWKGILKLMSSVTSQLEDIKLTQGSSGLSSIISKFGQLMTSILPLLSSECSKTVLDIINSICSLQASVRIQLFTLPKSIRPTLPAIKTDDANEIAKIGCAFASKNLLTSQVFEIITGVLENASSGEILPIHERGCVNCALNLLRERGTEEFRYDSKIISLLVKISNKSEDVIDLCMEVIKELSGMRFYSVISAIMTQKDEIIPILPKVVAAILETKNAAMNLMKVILNLNNDSASDSSWFTLEVLPQLSNVVSQISDEDYAKIFVSILEITKSTDSPFFFSIFGGENMKELLTEVEQERPLVFPLILSILPEDSAEYLSLLSLQLAEVSVESCSASLAYFFADLENVTEEMFTYLCNVLSANPFSAWSLQSQQIAVLIADNITNYESAFECAKIYISACDEDSLSSIWLSIIAQIKTDIDDWIDMISALANRVDPLSFAPIIPQLVVRSKDPKIGIIIGNICDALEKNGNQKSDIVEQVLTSKLFRVSDFIKEFVEMIKNGKYVTESIAALSIVCKDITPDNFYAIEAIIDEVTNIKSDEDDTCAINVLHDLIL